MAGHNPHGRLGQPNTSWNHLQVPSFIPRQPQLAHTSNERPLVRSPHTWHTPTPSEALYSFMAANHKNPLEMNPLLNPAYVRTPAVPFGSVDLSIPTSARNSLTPSPRNLNSPGLSTNTPTSSDFQSHMRPEKGVAVNNVNRSSLTSSPSPGVIQQTANIKEKMHGNSNGNNGELPPQTGGLYVRDAKQINSELAKFTRDPAGMAQSESYELMKEAFFHTLKNHNALSISQLPPARPPSAPSRSPSRSKSPTSPNQPDDLSTTTITALQHALPLLPLPPPPLLSSNYAQQQQLISTQSTLAAANSAAGATISPPPPPPPQTQSQSLPPPIVAATLSSAVHRSSPPSKIVTTTVTAAAAIVTPAIVTTSSHIVVAPSTETPVTASISPTNLPSNDDSVDSCASKKRRKRKPNKTVRVATAAATTTTTASGDTNEIGQLGENVDQLSRLSNFHKPDSPEKTSNAAAAAAATATIATPSCALPIASAPLPPPSTIAECTTTATAKTDESNKVNICKTATAVADEQDTERKPIVIQQSTSQPNVAETHGADTKLKLNCDGDELKCATKRCRRKSVTEDADVETIDKIAAMIANTEPAETLVVEVKPENLLLLNGGCDGDGRDDEMMSATDDAKVKEKSFEDVENKLEEMFAGIDDSRPQSNNNCKGSLSQVAAASGNCATTKKSHGGDTKAKRKRPTKKKAANKSGGGSKLKKHGKTGKSFKERSKFGRDDQLPMSGSMTGYATAIDMCTSGNGSSNGPVTATAGSSVGYTKYRGPYVQVKCDGTATTIVNTPIAEDDSEKVHNKMKFKKMPPHATVSGERNKIRGLHVSTLSMKYDADTTDRTWMCVFCKMGPHKMGLGDLFGPYILSTESPEFQFSQIDPAHDSFVSKRSRADMVQKSVIALPVVAATVAATFRSTQQSPTASTSKRKRKSSESVPPTAYSLNVVVQPNMLGAGGATLVSTAAATAPPEEINVFVGMTKANEKSYEVWAHEDCAVWSSGVHFIGARVVGLEAAVWTSSRHRCTVCAKFGAMLSCLHRGCTEEVHIPCAYLSNWTLNECDFKSRCHKHSPDCGGSAPPAVIIQPQPLPSLQSQSQSQLQLQSQPQSQGQAQPQPQQQLLLQPSPQQLLPSAPALPLQLPLPLPLPLPHVPMSQS